MTEEYFQLGRQAYRAWQTSRQFAQFDKDAPALDVMRLFLPTIPQDMMQISRPLPTNYRDWLRGFEDERNKDDKA